MKALSRMGTGTIGLVALMLAALPATAQTTAVVSAADPAGIVSLLEVGGYKPKLGKDSEGAPKIELDLDGYGAALYFYGCDEKTQTECDSLQLQAGFDRKTPWTNDAALKLAKQYRYASVWLDDEGDPIITWDLVTEDGIPAKVLLSSVRRFSEMIDEADDTIFAD